MSEFRASYDFEWDGDKYLIKARSAKIITPHSVLTERFATFEVFVQREDVEKREFWDQITDPGMIHRMVARYIAEIV